MDKIFISGLTIETIIGIYDWERTTRQRVILDLQMSADIAAAASTEDVSSALNYKTVSEALTELIENSDFQLIETMAERICEFVMTEFGVAWVQLTLHKPDALSGDTDVGVIIERGIERGERQ